MVSNNTQLLIRELGKTYFSSWPIILSRVRGAFFPELMECHLASFLVHFFFFFFAFLHSIVCFYHGMRLSCSRNLFTSGVLSLSVLFSSSSSSLHLHLHNHYHKNYHHHRHNFLFLFLFFVFYREEEEILNAFFGITH